MTHHNREWRREIDQYFGMKLTEDYYPEAWKTMIGRWIALRISLLELIRNIKREFLKGFKSKVKTGGGYIVPKPVEDYWKKREDEIKDKLKNKRS